MGQIGWYSMASNWWGLTIFRWRPTTRASQRTGLCSPPAIIIVEGLDLSAIEPGSYNLFCLPLKLVGSDGAPARVILVE